MCRSTQRGALKALAADAPAQDGHALRVGAGHEQHSLAGHLVPSTLRQGQPLLHGRPHKVGQVLGGAPTQPAGPRCCCQALACPCLGAAAWGPACRSLHPVLLRLQLLLLSELGPWHGAVLAASLGWRFDAWPRWALGDLARLLCGDSPL